MPIKQCDHDLLRLAAWDEEVLNPTAKRGKKFVAKAVEDAGLHAIFQLAVLMLILDAPPWPFPDLPFEIEVDDDETFHHIDDAVRAARLGNCGILAMDRWGKPERYIPSSFIEAAAVEASLAIRPAQSADPEQGSPL